MANGGQARGTPSVAASQGLTPQISIVNSDGTPTMFFFRWLMTIGGKTVSTALAASDLESLEPYDAGADAALAAGALDRVRAAGEIAGAFAEAPGAPAGQAAADAMLAAWLADRVPATPAPAETRDVLANIPTGLSDGDAGRAFYATDYQHTWLWTGSAWTFGDGDQGSGFIAWYMVAPRSGKWQLCDGSASISESRADGTIDLVNFPGLAAGTMPDLRNIYLRGAVAASGVIVPPASSAMTVGPADIGPQPGSVAAGTGSPVGVLTGISNNPHTHSITGPPEPGHIDAMPYYRL
jgi:hypothetical protein